MPKSKNTSPLLLIYHFTLAKLWSAINSSLETLRSPSPVGRSRSQSYFIQRPCLPPFTLSGPRPKAPPPLFYGSQTMIFNPDYTSSLKSSSGKDLVRVSFFSSQFPLPKSILSIIHFRLHVKSDQSGRNSNFPCTVHCTVFGRKKKKKKHGA